MLENKIWEPINQYTSKHKLIEQGDGIVIGLSGGADSICLARYLLYLRESMQLKLLAVHVNHMLRPGEADRDQSFVEEFCKEWDLPLELVVTDVEALSKELGCSTEEAGRKVRYEVFAKVAAREECHKIATAHHQNDLAETMLFRMARGTGIAGLSAIAAKKGGMIRPLLAVSKEEIYKILRTLSQGYVEDSTNQLDDYSRNFIRHEILPKMERINSQAVRHLAMLSDRAEEVLAYLTPKMDRLYEEKVEKRREGLFLAEAVYREMESLEQEAILHRMIKQAGGHEKDIGAVHVEGLKDLMDKARGKWIALPYHTAALKTGQGILLGDFDRIQELTEKASGCSQDFSREVLLNHEGEAEIPLPDGSTVVFQKKMWEGSQIVKRDWIKFFDYDMIKDSLLLRYRQPGDYLVSDQEGHKKLLKRYFIDQKIPAEKRQRCLLLAEGSHILWVFGGRISEDVKVTDQTTTVLQVGWIPKGEQ